MQMVVTATHYERADLVGVLIYLGEDDVYHPEIVDAGICELQTSAGDTIASQHFTKYAGNSDGSFKVFFIHPPVYASQWSGLKIYTELQVGEDTYRQEVQVSSYKKEDSHIPLEANDLEMSSEILQPEEGGIQGDGKPSVMR